MDIEKDVTGDRTTLASAGARGGTAPTRPEAWARWLRRVGIASLALSILAGAGVVIASGMPGAPVSLAPGARPPGQQEPPRWEVDAEASELVVVLHKAGLLRFLGHEHGILARDWSAEVRYDEDDLAASRIVVSVPAESLEIDSPEARAAAEVDPDGPEGEDLEEIRQKMVGPEQLDAASHPEIRFESDRIEADGDEGLRIHGTLSIRGQSRQVEVEATREVRDEGLRIRGELEIEHRDFGIEPVSIGGVVKVANEMDVRFAVLARPAVTDRR